MTLARRLVLSCVPGLLLLCPLVGRAQNSIATPDGVVTALRLGPGDVIGLDGVPDEAVWKRAAVATGFLQREPDNGAPATESTEVRLVYDDDRLILGVVLYDSAPERILGNQMQRDQSFGADDRFMWTIDSFLDGRRGRGKHRRERRPRGRGLFGVSRAAPRPPAVVLRRPVYAPVGASTSQQRSPHGRARFPAADVDLSKRSQRVRLLQDRRLRGRT